MRIHLYFVVAFILVANMLKAQTSAPINISSGSFPAAANLSNKSVIWADPKSGVIAQNARYFSLSGSIDNTGFLGTSFSKDEGVTWSLMQGPIYWNDAGNSAQGQTFSVARYPLTALYNPYANTLPDSTYISFTSAVRDNSNPNFAAGDWGAHGYGVYNPTSQIKHQHQISTDADTNDLRLLLGIQDDYFITQDGHSWTIDLTGWNRMESDTLHPFPYNDTIYCDYGTWNPSSHDFDVGLRRIYAPLTKKIYGNTQKADARIAFAPEPNSNIGWISIIGHDSFSFDPDTLNYFLLFKTIDGGQTWAAPIRINLSQISAVTKNAGDPIYIDQNNFPTYRNVIAPIHDLAVDYTGIPHIICSLGKIDMLSTSMRFDKYSSVVTFWLDNINGTSYSGKVLAHPMGFWGCYGSCDPYMGGIISHNKVQIATSWDGKKMFYIWNDEDTVTHPSINASYGFNLQNPDLWAAGYNIVSNTWTSNPDNTTQNISTLGTNITIGTAAEGVANYPNLSYYVLDNATNQYGLAISYSDTVYKNSFSSDVNNYYLGYKMLQLGDAELLTNKLQMSLYPNPANSEVNISLKDNYPGFCHFIIRNVLGQEIMHSDKRRIDISKLSNGIYLITVYLNEEPLTTGKFIKQ